MDRTTPPVFSLIVATLGRDNDLRMLLDSLQSQTFKDFEVIIVDQNEKDFIAGIVKDYSGSLDIRQIRQDLKGASRARNKGLERAKGSIITFPDDDCEYPPDLLQTVLERLSSSSLAGITVMSRDKLSTEHISRFPKQGGAITRYNILSRAIEFGIFVKATALGTTRFDEDLGVGASTPWHSDEGPDLVYRLIQGGHEFRYFPDIVIFHPNPVINYNDKAFDRAYRYGCGRGRYMRKHRYPIWFAMYVWGLYVGGMAIGAMQLNAGKVRYYYSGLKGRIRGYFSK